MAASGHSRTVVPSQACRSAGSARRDLASGRRGHASPASLADKSLAKPQTSGKFRDEQGHYLRERHRAVCGSLLNPRTIYRRVTSRFFIHGCSMTKNLLLGSIAGNFLPVEDRQRCAKPARFAQGTSGGLSPCLLWRGGDGLQRRVRALAQYR